MTRARLAACALAAMAATACKGPSPRATTAAAVSVTIGRVGAARLAGGLSAPGLLVSREEAAVAPELAGYVIRRVLVDEGALVTRGQPLAILDDSLLAAQLAQGQAGVAQQVVAAERARAEADRVKGLDDKGVISNEQIIERRLAARSADAAVAVARAQLQDLRTREAKMTVRAPVSGRVLERTARPGDASSPASPLFRIAAGGLVELDAALSERDLADIGAGEPATVELPSGARVQGAVRFVSPRIDPQTRLGKVRIALPVRGDLRPGGYGRAVFAAVSDAAAAVPEAAVRYDGDGATVMVVDARDIAHRVAVRTGRRGGGLVELVQGPGPGARVALGGSAFLLDGDEVRPVEAARGGGGR